MVDLRGQNKIRLGQSIDRVGPGRDLNLAPSQHDVGMMALLFGYFADTIHESQRGFKVGKLVRADKVVLIDGLPLRWFRQLLVNFPKLVPLQWRNSTATGDAIAVSQLRCSHRFVWGRASRPSISECKRGLLTPASR